MNNSPAAAFDWAAIRKLGSFVQSAPVAVSPEVAEEVEIMSSQDMIAFNAYKGRARREAEAVEWFTPKFSGKITDIKASAHGDDACIITVTTPHGMEIYLVPDEHKEESVRRLVIRPTTYQTR